MARTARFVAYRDSAPMIVLDDGRAVGHPATPGRRAIDASAVAAARWPTPRLSSIGRAALMARELRTRGPRVSR